MSRRAAIALASTLLGLALVAGVAAWAGVGEAAAALGRIGVGGCVAYVMLCFTVMLLQGLGWWVLLRSEGHAVGIGTVAEAMLIGGVFGWITPSAYLGGEPVRAYLVARAVGTPLRLAFATVMLHKFQEMSGFLFFLLIGTWTVLAHYRAAFPTWMLAGLAAFALAATACCGVFLDSFAHQRGTLARCLGALTRLGFRHERVARWQGLAADMEAQVHGAFHARRGATLLAHVVTASSLLLVWLKPALLVHLSGASAALTLPQISVFFVTTQVLMAFQPTPGGLGINEGGFVAVYALLGVPAAEAVAFMAVVRLADAALLGCGLFLLARRGWQSVILAAFGDTSARDLSAGGP